MVKIRDGATCLTLSSEKLGTAPLEAAIDASSDPRRAGSPSAVAEAAASTAARAMAGRRGASFSLRRTSAAAAEALPEHGEWLDDPGRGTWTVSLAGRAEAELDPRGAAELLESLRRGKCPPDRSARRRREPLGPGSGATVFRVPPRAAESVEMSLQEVREQRATAEAMRREAAP